MRVKSPTTTTASVVSSGTIDIRSFVLSVDPAGDRWGSIRVAGQLERGPEVRVCVRTVVLPAGEDRGGESGRLAGPGGGSVSGVGEYSGYTDGHSRPDGFDAILAT